MSEWVEVGPGLFVRDVVPDRVRILAGEVQGLGWNYNVHIQIVSSGGRGAGALCWAILYSGMTENKEAAMHAGDMAVWGLASQIVEGMLGLTNTRDGH